MCECSLTILLCCLQLKMTNYSESRFILLFAEFYSLPISLDDLLFTIPIESKATENTRNITAPTISCSNILKTTPSEITKDAQ